MADKAAGAPVSQAVTALFDGIMVRDAYWNLVEALKEVDAEAAASTGLSEMVDKLSAVVNTDKVIDTINSMDKKLLQCYYRGQYVLTADSDEEARLNLSLPPRK